MDLSGGAQTGDVSARDSAGRDIIHAGLDPGAAFIFIKEYVWRVDQERERRDQEISDRLDRLTNTVEAYQIMAERRRDADNARTRRHIRLLYALIVLVSVVAMIGLL